MAPSQGSLGPSQDLQHRGTPGPADHQKNGADRTVGHAYCKDDASDVVTDWKWARLTWPERLFILGVILAFCVGYAWIAKVLL
jgi:hypothetical protein